MIKEKIIKAINTECDYAEKNGSSKLSVCDHYNWDKDLWVYRHAIIDEIKSRGYDVSVSDKWGVTDIVTTQKLSLR